MARTRSQSTRVNIPIVKIEENDVLSYSLKTGLQSQEEKSRFHKKTNSSFSSLNNDHNNGSRIKRTLNSLKPSYKPKRPRYEQNMSEKIHLVNSSMTGNLQHLGNLKEQVEILNRFKILKNFDIDIRTIKLLTSNLEEYNEHDLKLIEILKENDDCELGAKLYDFYNIEAPIMMAQDQIPVNDAATQDQEEIPFL